jgi:hypothetical protein
VWRQARDPRSRAELRPFPGALGARTPHCRPRHRIPVCARPLPARCPPAGAREELVSLHVSHPPSRTPPPRSRCPTAQTPVAAKSLPFTSAGETAAAGGAGAASPATPAHASVGASPGSAASPLSTVTAPGDGSASSPGLLLGGAGGGVVAPPEPLLMENKSRFVLFPIKHGKVRAPPWGEGGGGAGGCRGGQVR